MLSDPDTQQACYLVLTISTECCMFVIRGTHLPEHHLTVPGTSEYMEEQEHLNTTHGNCCTLCSTLAIVTEDEDEYILQASSSTSWHVS